MIVSRRARTTPQPSTTRANRQARTGKRRFDLRRVTVLALYGSIVMVTIVEAATRQPVVATLTTDAIARARGAHEHPDPPDWAGATNILVMPNMPGDLLGFTGGNTIVLTRHALHDDGILRHELTHAKQYKRLTTFGTAATYLVHATRLLIQSGGDPTTAYFHHPFELEAYTEQFGPHWPTAIGAARWP